jgi:RNA polymerase sigma-70 factor (ECF subfamily)
MLSSDGKLGPRSWKTGLEKLKVMLTEDNPLTPNSEAQMAGEAMQCRVSEAIDFERAYRMYNKRVYAKCLHMVGNAAEAEDLTQEVFLQLFRKIDSFRGESAFSTWLYRVAVNIVLARLRRKSHITSSLEEVAELKEGVSRLQHFLSAPDSVLTTVIDRLNLERAFSQMPAGYRKVFLMHDLEGYEHHEIARILGFSVGTSKSQLYKARVRMRDLLHSGEAKQLRSAMISRPRNVPQGGDRRSRCSRHSSFAGSCG